MEQFRGRYPIKRQRSVNMDDEISGTFFGRQFRVKGRDILPWILVAVLVVACGYLVDLSITKWGTPVDLGKTMTAYRTESSEQHERIRATIDSRLKELNYLISITPEERAKLGLDMPDTLRDQRAHKGDK